MSESGRPRLRTRILVALLVPVAVLALLEFGLRIAGYRFEPWAAYGEGYAEWREDYIYAKDPELLWTLRPSARIRDPGSGFLNVRTNAEGFRRPELPGEREPGEIRVLCLGDSVTYGLGLFPEQTWPHQAELALREMFPDRPVRVINGGVPGWSSVQGMRLLERWRDLRPDVVVFWFGMNDAKPARTVADRDQRIPGEKATEWLRWLRGLRVFQLVQAAVTGARRATAADHRVSVEEFRESVERLREEEARGGPRVVFVATPQCLALTISQFRRMIARAEETGAELVLGTSNLVSPVGPAPPGELRGVPTRRDGVPAIAFGGPGANQVATLEQMRERLATLEAYEASLDRLLAELPPTRLDREDLLGDEPDLAVLQDNCHLTGTGARLAGRAVAEAIRRELED